MIKILYFDKLDKKLKEGSYSGGIIVLCFSLSIFCIMSSLHKYQADIFSFWEFFRNVSTLFSLCCQYLSFIPIYIIRSDCCISSWLNSSYLDIVHYVHITIQSQVLWNLVLKSLTVLQIYSLYFSLDSYSLILILIHVNSLKLTFLISLKVLLMLCSSSMIRIFAMVIF